MAAKELLIAYIVALGQEHVAEPPGWFESAKPVTRSIKLKLARLEIEANWQLRPLQELSDDPSGFVVWLLIGAAGDIPQGTGLAEHQPETIRRSQGGAHGGQSAAARAAHSAFRCEIRGAVPFLQNRRHFLCKKIRKLRPATEVSHAAARIQIGDARNHNRGNLPLVNQVLDRR